MFLIVFQWWLWRNKSPNFHTSAELFFYVSKQILLLDCSKASPVFFCLSMFWEKAVVKNRHHISPLSSFSNIVENLEVQSLLINSRNATFPLLITEEEPVKVVSTGIPLIDVLRKWLNRLLFFILMGSMFTILISSMGFLSPFHAVFIMSNLHVLHVEYFYVFGVCHVSSCVFRFFQSVFLYVFLITS